MKRTGFKPRTKPMAAGLTGLLSSASFGFGRKPAARMKRKPKAVPAAERAHYKCVAALPCVRCGIEGFSQAAHSNRHQDGKGLGLKADSLATFPLCCTRPGVLGCHYEYDNCVGMTRAQADALTVLYIADTHNKLGVGQ